MARSFTNADDLLDLASPFSEEGRNETRDDPATEPCLFKMDWEDLDGRSASSGRVEPLSPRPIGKEPPWEGRPIRG